MVLPVNNPTKSYWIEAAESPLRDCRSTVDLPQETDVVIVGSGYTGASTAYWLHKVPPAQNFPLSNKMAE
jgi:ribulose 1,5-bisphosphate synthetase/thiazole synthase